MGFVQSFADHVTFLLLGKASYRLAPVRTADIPKGSAVASNE